MTEAVDGHVTTGGPTGELLLQAGSRIPDDFRVLILAEIQNNPCKERHFCWCLPGCNFGVARPQSAAGRDAEDSSTQRSFTHRPSVSWSVETR